MAYDPEARAQSNSAMIIGVVALVLLVGGALAYFSTRNPNPDVAVVPAPARETVVVEQPAPAPASPVVIERPSSPVVVTPPVTRTVERNTTVTRERAVPVTPPARTAETRTETTVNVNIPRSESSEPNRTTAQPQAGSDPAEPPPPAVQ
jgi:hypothetical protein